MAVARDTADGPQWDRVRAPVWRITDSSTVGRHRSALFRVSNDFNSAVIICTTPTLETDRNRVLRFRPKTKPTPKAEANFRPKTETKTKLLRRFRPKT